MRAVAAGLVVSYHAGLSPLPGSFVGVDAFFVISGFLITGMLMSEIGRSGTVSLTGFYARRLRRLLPAALFVLLVTLVAAKVLLPPLTLTEITRDVMFSAVHLGNFWFAYNGTDYLADPTPSLVQHYWSLGVEEQFYLIWPLFLLLVARKSDGRVRRTALWIGVAAAVSLALSVVVTDFSRGLAFFLLPTRAWELAAGALVALAIPLISTLPAAVKAAISWAGLVGLIVSAAVISDTLPFPGWIALLPVLSTCAMIAGNDTERGVRMLLALPPFQFIGKISYSLYLWHWPLFLIPALLLPRELNLLEKLGLTVVAVVLSWLTWRFIEETLRAAPVVTARKRRSYAMAAGMTVIVLLAGVVVGRLPALYTNAVAPEANIALASSGTEFPTSVPSNLQPTLLGARKDLPQIYEDKCEAAPADTTPIACEYGDTASDRTVVLFGDSHASQWFPAMERYASSRSTKLVTMTKSACPPVDIEMYSTLLQRPFTECDQWRAAALQHIAELKPDLVVVSAYSTVYSSVWQGTGDYDAAWSSGLTSVLTALPPTASTLVLGDTPHWKTAPAVCLSANLDNSAECVEPVGDVTDSALSNVEERAAAAAGADYVDSTQWLCNSTCFPMVGDILIYRDEHHLSAHASAALAPVLGAELDRMTPNGRPSS
ncbi:acyltransferase [Rhodococcoides trifolii]|uniref:Acyltransferase n=1 Tax=Rhodococcoides trifolii TaxID=908250 RepID=A0A917G4C5_9NOCA|nr:acyltransferase [Rhodococcus trifolii]